LGLGFWGLGFGFWGFGPNPQSPIPNPHPQSPIPINMQKINKYFIIKIKIINLEKNNEIIIRNKFFFEKIKNIN
jgi:hypothetical protein